MFKLNSRKTRISGLLCSGCQGIPVSVELVIANFGLVSISFRWFRMISNGFQLIAHGVRWFWLVCCFSSHPQLFSAQCYISYRTKQKTGFCMKWNSGLKWFKKGQSKPNYGLISMVFESIPPAGNRTHGSDLLTNSIIILSEKSTQVNVADGYECWCS